MKYERIKFSLSYKNLLNLCSCRNNYAEELKATRVDWRASWKVRVVDYNNFLATAKRDKWFIKTPSRRI